MSKMEKRHVTAIFADFCLLFLRRAWTISHLARLLCMDHEAEKDRVEAQLAMCRKLAHAYTGVTAENLQKLTRQLEDRLRELAAPPRNDN
jgi:hypothetical protein